MQAGQGNTMSIHRGHS